MSITRQQLLDEGWRQGVVLHPDDITKSFEEVFDGYIILTQTCDCLCTDFDAEPHLELLPFRRIEATDVQELLKNGRNPRKIQFSINYRDEPIVIEATLADILWEDRKNYESFRIDKEYSIPYDSLKGLVHWRAQKYLRHAFPDSFEKALEPIAKRLRKKISKYHDSIHSLLIHVHPDEELRAGEKYEVDLRLMIHPDTMGKGEAHYLELKKLEGEIKELLCKITSFHSPNCSLHPLEKMSLYDLESFVDFSRFDYLSFEDEA